MSEIAPSIQDLLQLSNPLPRSITDELRLGHPFLLHLDDEFRSLAGDMQVWTFYETIESRLSGEADSRPGEIYVTAPITSLKSAILGIRQETIYPLQSDHANCASFGRNNAETLKLFLKTFTRSIMNADRTSKDKTHTPLNLEDKVPIEVHGFYEDTIAVTSAETLTTMRTWSTRVPLSDFFVKGPLECINDRLNEMNDGSVDGQPAATRRRTLQFQDGNVPAPPSVGPGTNHLGIAVVIDDGRRTNSEIVRGKGATVDGVPAHVHSERMASPAAPDNSPDPEAVAAGDARHTSRDAVRSRSTSATRGKEGSSAESPRHRRRVALARRFTDQFNPRWSGPLERPAFHGPPFSTDSPFGPGGQVPDDTDPHVPVFVKPESDNRRYIWTHLPFTNPFWVKVSSLNNLCCDGLSD
jgi:hypothetical protein